MLYSSLKCSSEVARPFSYTALISGSDFSYTLLTKELQEVYDIIKDEKFIESVAVEIEQAIVDVLIKKTIKAAKDYKIKTVLLGGGVAANRYLREKLEALVLDEFPDVDLRLPDLSITGDNAIMIAEAALARALFGIENKNSADIRAVGNLSLAD